jgi:hypothetical protein
LPNICAGNDSLKLALCNVESCNNPIILTVDASANVGQYSSVKIGDNNLPVISYFNDTKKNLRLAICSDPACNNATFVTVDSKGTVGVNTSIVLDSSGFPIISYYDVTNGGLKLASYSDGNVPPIPGNERVYMPVVLSN